MSRRSYGRRGQSLRGYLLDEFNPEGVQVPAAYQLDVVLRQESNALAIQLDNTADPRQPDRRGAASP